MRTKSRKSFSLVRKALHRAVLTNELFNVFWVASRAPLWSGLTLRQRQRLRRAVRRRIDYQEAVKRAKTECRALIPQSYCCGWWSENHTTPEADRYVVSRESYNTQPEFYIGEVCDNELAAWKSAIKKAR